MRLCLKGPERKPNVNRNANRSVNRNANRIANWNVHRNVNWNANSNANCISTVGCGILCKIPGMEIHKYS